MAIFTAIGTAIGAALFGAGTLAASIAGSVISGGLMLGARLALSYINRPKKTLSTAVQGQVQLGGDVPVQVLFGTGKTKGHRLYYAKWGAGNRNNDELFVLANGRCDGLEPYIYFYGEKHDLISQTPVGNEHARYTVDGFGSYLVIKFYDGRPGQLADSELVSVTAGLGNPWKATSTVAGHTYVVVSRTWDASLFGKGRPEFEFVLRGWCEYDARKDDSVPGGEGDHRLNNPSTWEFTQNPAIHRLNFQLGLRGLLSGDVLVGVGKSINQIDVAMHMVAANVCDAERTVGGRTIPTYHCNLFVSAEDDHLAVLQMMEDAMAGYAVNRAGLDGVLAGATQVPVLEITAADIRTDAPRSAKNRRSGFDSINILSGQFTSIEAHWNPESLTTVSVNADIVADGRKRPAGNDFLQVTDPDIAQYLLNIRYRQNRKAKQRSLPVSRKVGTRLQPGDWVTYEGIDWLVSKWGFDAKFQFTLELAETGDDVYDEAGITAGPVIAPPLTPANPSLISTVAGFGTAAGLIEGVNGAQVPALQFTWDDPQDPTVTAIRIEYRKNGTTEPVFYAVSNDPASGSLTISSQIMSATTYDARATITTVPDRLKSWTGWKTTSTATASLQVVLAELGSDVVGRFEGIETDVEDVVATATQTAEDLAQEVTDRANAVAAEAASRVELAQAHAGDIRRSRDGLLELANEIVELGSNAVLDRQEIRQSLTSAIGDVTAAYEQAITVATGPDSALVSVQTNLAAQIADTNATIDSINLAYADADAAIALQTTTLATQMRGAYTGSDWTQAGGMISQINSSITSQYESLSEAIASVSAGVGEQFDFARIWNFDSAIQDWTGNGTPTWVSGGGWLRPANHATDPYVISPSGLAIDLDTYGHVRLRIRKTGAPAWVGQLWWKLTGDGTWDAGRRITIAEPAFDSGISVVLFDLDTTGELDQIRIDLSSDQGGTDCFEIDWIAVGRPSPGASVASVNTINTALTNAINSEASSREALAVNLTGVTDPAGLELGDLSSGLIYVERVARVAADSSMQSDITTLSGSLAAAEGNINATADAVAALDIRVEATEDGVSTLSSDLTALTGTVAGKADTSALDELATEINIGNLEGLSAQATGMRALEASLLDAAMETVELGADARLADQGINNAMAAVRQETYARTEQNEAATTAVAGRVDVLEATLPGKADASYVSSVEARVAWTEAGLTAAVEAIDLQEVALGDKADASALATTNTAVSTLDGEVTTLASQVSSVEAKANDATASGLVKFEAVAAPAGVTSRFAVMLRQTVGGAYKTAGFYLDLRMVGGELVSEFAVLSDRFVVTDGANTSYPLVFESGVLKLENIVVGTVKFDRLESHNEKVILQGSGSTPGLEVYS